MLGNERRFQFSEAGISCISPLVSTEYYLHERRREKQVIAGSKERWKYFGAWRL